MQEFLTSFFAESLFIPHGDCYLSNPALVWLHIASDSLIALAYYSIPIALVYFVQKQRDLPFNWIFLLFGAFMVSCGTTHIMEIWALWHPTYWWGFVKALTAGVSVYTAVAMVPLIPQALRYAMRAQLNTNQTLQTLIQASPLAIATLNTHGKVTMWNPAAERLFGWSEPEVLGGPLPIIPQDQQEAFRAILQAEIKGEEHIGIELRRQRKDGSLIDVGLWTAPLFDENGVVISTLGLFVDISDRVRAEQALRESQEQLQAILDHSPTVIYVKDTQGRFILVNRQFSTLFHIDPQEAKGKSDRDLFSKEIADALQENDQKILEAGTPLEIEEVVPQNDGLHTYISIKFPLKDSAGVAYGICGISSDISDRKRAEVALREQEEFLRTIYNGLEQSIFVVDVVATENSQVSNQKESAEAFRENPHSGSCCYDFRYAGWNPVAERLAGMSSAAGCGKTPEQVLGAAIGSWVRQTLANCLDAGTSITYEECITFQGVEASVLTTLNPLRDESGRIYRIIGTSYNITERKRAEEELRQSEARFRELATREALLNQIANQIRGSLELDTILESAVSEIRNLLQVERCQFIWYQVDAVPPSWLVVQEAKNSDLPSFIGKCIPGTDIALLTAKAFAKEMLRVEDTGKMSDAQEKQFFLCVGYSAILSMPIYTQSGEVAVISCSHSSTPRLWSDTEVELLEAVAAQIAIAIDQAALYKQSRTAAVVAQTKAQQLEQALCELQQTQAKLIQSEKMSSLGQLVAGVAHEINNPVNFIYGNITPANEYAEGLLKLLQLYQEYYPNPPQEIQDSVAETDLDFIKEDLPKILSSMKLGADRIRQIVLSLRNFSRLDEADMKRVDIHEGIDSTLLILQNRLKAKPNRPAILVIKEYGNLPLVECYPGQLNQVFMNILTNAIDALEESLVIGHRSLANDKGQMTNDNPQIRICTQVLESSRVLIQIADNGPGMTEDVRCKLFDPFFTTKPVGKGTGLGMSISYQIVEKHGGQLTCISSPGEGAEFFIQIPIGQHAS